MKLIGVAGSFASGKDTVAHYLVEKYGFYHISTSDIVREEALKRYGSVERPILYKTANEIRSGEGDGALSEKALKRYEAVKDEYPNGLVVTGFRAQAEADVVKNAGGVIIFVDAPFEVRFARMQERSRDGEAIISKEDFLEREQNENGGVNPAYNISAIKQTADVVYDNITSIENMQQMIDNLLSR